MKPPVSMTTVIPTWSNQSERTAIMLSLMKDGAWHDVPCVAPRFIWIYLPQDTVASVTSNHRNTIRSQSQPSRRFWIWWNASDSVFWYAWLLSKYLRYGNTFDFFLIRISIRAEIIVIIPELLDWGFCPGSLKLSFPEAKIGSTILHAKIV